MTSGDKGEAPDDIKRTRPPSFALILLNINLSHIGDDVEPEYLCNIGIVRKRHQCAFSRTSY